MQQDFTLAISGAHVAAKSRFQAPTELPLMTSTFRESRRRLYSTRVRTESNVSIISLQENCAAEFDDPKFRKRSECSGAAMRTALPVRALRLTTSCGHWLPAAVVPASPSAEGFEPRRWREHATPGLKASLVARDSCGSKTGARARSTQSAARDRRAARLQPRVAARPRRRRLGPDGLAENVLRTEAPSGYKYPTRQGEEARSRKSAVNFSSDIPRRSTVCAVLPLI